MKFEAQVQNIWRSNWSVKHLKILMFFESINVCAKQRNPWHYFFLNSHLISLKSFKLLHILNVVVSSHHDCLKISLFINFKIVRYLLLHWRSNVIAAEVHCNLIIVYKVQINLCVYEQSIRFKFSFKKASRRICKSVEKTLIQYLE
jgi:hypothetical protein